VVGRLSRSLNRKGKKGTKNMKGSEGIGPPRTGPERQRQMIERAPRFQIGALISESRSRFNHLPLQFFLPFVPFMLFLFGVDLPLRRDDAHWANRYSGDQPWTTSRSQMMQS
jgi:hypothetical protein